MIEILKSPVFWWIAGILIIPGILMWIASYPVASYCVYTQTLKRSKKDQWSREMPKDIDPMQKPMYLEGGEWSKRNASRMQEVHIVNNGLNLYGEYYDFGSDRCAVILSGRTESLKYGYYFAIPYAECGFNILVLDPRAHGNSDGEYNTVGFEESRDDIAWLNYLKDNFGIRSVVLHGICIGAAGGMLALTSGDGPDIVDGIVTEGMFANFSGSVKNHLIERKKPVFIMLDLIDGWMIKYTGHSMKYGPIDVIDKLDIPLLMLHSKEDIYSTPEYAQKLYDKAGSGHKELVWFEHGRHSMLRITDTELYDSSIKKFINSIPRRDTSKKEEQNVL